jgi:hypothetical protein
VKANLNKCVLRSDLKEDKLEADLMVCGNEFQSSGAATAKER